MRRSGLLALAILACVPTYGFAQLPTCAFRGAPDALRERPAPLDSVSFALGGDRALLCYGRPSVEEHTMGEGLAPAGSPWQMGANEPTTLHLPFPALVGSVRLEPGAYSLYAIPEETEWLVVVNGNSSRWGTPIDADVRAADVGSFAVVPERLPEHRRVLTFRFERSGPSAGHLVFAWAWTSLSIPIERR